MAKVGKTANDQESIENIFLSQFLQSIAAGTNNNPYVSSNIPCDNPQDYVELTWSDQKATSHFASGFPPADYG